MAGWVEEHEPPCLTLDPEPDAGSLAAFVASAAPAAAAEAARGAAPATAA